MREFIFDFTIKDSFKKKKYNDQIKQLVIEEYVKITNDNSPSIKKAIKQLEENIYILLTHVSSAEINGSIKSLKNLLEDKDSEIAKIIADNHFKISYYNRRIYYKDKLLNIAEEPICTTLNENGQLCAYYGCVNCDNILYYYGSRNHRCPEILISLDHMIGGTKLQSQWNDNHKLLYAYKIKCPITCISKCDDYDFYNDLIELFEYDCFFEKNFCRIDNDKLRYLEILEKNVIAEF